MPDLYTRKADYNLVIQNENALKFHAQKFLLGYHYPLAKQCWQYCQHYGVKLD